MVAAAPDHRGPVSEQRHIALLVLATILTWKDPPAAAGVTMCHGSVMPAGTQRQEVTRSAGGAAPSFIHPRAPRQWHEVIVSRGRGTRCYLSPAATQKIFIRSSQLLHLLCTRLLSDCEVGQVGKLGA